MRLAAAPVAAMPSGAPPFGEHNRQGLAELGYGEREIRALVAAKAIGDAPFGLPPRR